MSSSSNSQELLERIHAALEAARAVLNRFTPGAIETEYKVGHDPVTEADRAVDDILRKTLLRPGEGWLSEETVDDFTRLDKERVWVVDPLDGTREFVQGIPEFCVSIAMVENGVPVAGGICNPATDELILGSRETGVTYNGKPSQPSQRRSRQYNSSRVYGGRSKRALTSSRPLSREEFQNRPLIMPAASQRRGPLPTIRFYGVGQIFPSHTLALIQVRRAETEVCKKI